MGLEPVSELAAPRILPTKPPNWACAGKAIAPKPRVKLSKRMGRFRVMAWRYKVAT